MLLSFFTKTEVKKNLTISIIGVGIGQLIHLFFTPVISRLYTPEQFGEFSLFLSILAVLSSASLMKFDLAIITCEEREVNSIYLLIRKICSTIVGILVFFTGCFLILGHHYLKLSLFLTIAVLVFNQFWSLRAILNKYSLFKTLSLSKIFENLTNGISAILIAFLGFKDIGLFISKILGVLIAVIIFKRKSNGLYPIVTSKLKPLFVKYIKFPKYSFPSELLSNLNFNSSIFLFSYFFTSVEVGFIGLTTRVLSVPTNFVSISFLDVFKQKAVADYKESKKFDTIFLKFLLILSILATIMIALIFSLGPSLFSYFFGSEWQKAGEYAKYICILYALRFVATPLIFSFEITGKNHINLIFQSIYFILGVSTIIGTYLLTKNDLLCVTYYSLTLSVVYIVHIFVAYLTSRST